MDTNFWLNKWRSAKLGFHEAKPNPHLTTHIDTLALNHGSRVFIPLCGKTNDIAWLLAQGYKVVGVELIEIAIEQLFKDLSVEPEVTVDGELKRYRAPSLDIYVGDVFKLDAKQMGQVDAVYDRAALVALPKDTRPEYARHLINTCGKAPQLLISYHYDQSLMSGPPFSVTDLEIAQHYNDHYAISLLSTVHINAAFNGKCDASEHAWLLKPRYITA